MDSMGCMQGIEAALLIIEPMLLKEPGSLGLVVAAQMAIEAGQMLADRLERQQMAAEKLVAIKQLAFGFAGFVEPLKQPNIVKAKLDIGHTVEHKHFEDTIRHTIEHIAIDSEHITIIERTVEHIAIIERIARRITADTTSSIVHTSAIGLELKDSIAIVQSTVDIAIVTASTSCTAIGNTAAIVERKAAD